MSWTVRFRGRDEREVLAHAELFWLEQREVLSLSRREFFARLLVAPDGTEAVFLAEADPEALAQAREGSEEPGG